MKRKHNPLVSLAALVLLLTILVLICTGCTAEAKDPLTTYKNSDRFTVERYYYGDMSMPDCYIITDTETGAQYLACTWRNSAGLTVLQPGEE